MGEAQTQVQVQNNIQKKIASRLNGLSKNVVALKIERAQLKRQLVIDLE